MKLVTGATFNFRLSKGTNTIKGSWGSNFTRVITYDVPMEKRTEFEGVINEVGKVNRNDKLVYSDKQRILTAFRKQLLYISNEPA